MHTMDKRERERGGGGLGKEGWRGGGGVNAAGKSGWQRCQTQSSPSATYRQRRTRGMSSGWHRQSDLNIHKQKKRVMICSVNTRKDILLDSPADAENLQSLEFNPCTSRKQKALGRYDFPGGGGAEFTEHRCRGLDCWGDFEMVD